LEQGKRMQEWNFALAIGANLMKEENYENLRFELVCLFVCLFVCLKASKTMEQTHQRASVLLNFKTATFKEEKELA
jgi:hypothetical protein